MAVYNERQGSLLRLLEEKGRLSVEQLSRLLGVSAITIRRDLSQLSNAGLIHKVYGGAVLADHAVSGSQKLLQFQIRESLHADLKQAIGRKAAELVEDNDCIFIGDGTSCLEMARCLSGRGSLSIVTNSLPVLLALADSPSAVYCLGGSFRGSEQSVAGQLAIDSLERFCIRKCFLGVGGIGDDLSLSDFTEASAALSRRLIASQAPVTLLADSTKFGAAGPHRIGHIQQLSALISDHLLSEARADSVLDQGVRLILTEAGR